MLMQGLWWDVTKVDRRKTASAVGSRSWKDVLWKSVTVSVFSVSRENTAVRIFLKGRDKQKHPTPQFRSGFQQSDLLEFLQRFLQQKKHWTGFFNHARTYRGLSCWLPSALNQSQGWIASLMSFLVNSAVILKRIFWIFQRLALINWDARNFLFLSVF